MFPIFKVKHKDHTYIFNGDVQEANSTIIKQPIHIDDTIDTIKRKILAYTPIQASFSQLYLYGIKKERILPNILYEQLTQEGELPLTRKRILAFAKNIIDFDVSIFEEKDEYFQNDLLPMTKNIEFIKFPIGQKFIINKKFPFTVDPFQMETEDAILEKYAEKITTTENKYMLLQYPAVVNNTIFVCTAKDILEKTEKKELVIKLYFPLLWREGVKNLEELNERSEELKENTTKIINKTFEKYTKQINLFYSIYKEQPLVPIVKGIKELFFVMHPVNIINFPVDIIFKLIHASPQLPFLKFNPGTRRENIYRLFSPSFAKDGRKIPLLKRTEILKYGRLIGKRNSVSMVLDDNIMCEFTSNGDLSVIIKTKQPKSIEEIEQHIQKKLNPILTNIDQYLQQSGYNYFSFETLSAENIEIINIEYLYQVAADKKLFLQNLSTTHGCVSTIFTVLKERAKMKLQFKHVAYYNEMDAIDAFITNMVKYQFHPTKILHELRENFDLNESEAQLKYSDWLNEKQIEKDRYENKKIKVLSNPGFPIELTWSQDLLFTVKNIDNIHYLRTIPMYLNSLVKMLGEPALMSLCKGEEIELKPAVVDIIASVEENFADRESANIIEAGEIIFDEDDADDDLLDMFGADDDDEDESALYSDDEEDEEEDDVSKKDLSIVSNVKSAPTMSPELDDEDLIGRSLSNPNYFQKKLMHYDPVLFLTKKEGKFKQYSRSCAVNIRRQPVILTNKEFEEIKNTTPDKIKLAIKYGSKEKYWYVCPQYWCLQNNKPLTKKDLETAKEKGEKLCGNSTNPYENIIPFNAKTVPKGKYIYSFIDFDQKKSQQVKITEYPGFFVGKHPDPKLCIPCCFNIPNSKKQAENREKCGAEVWTPGHKDSKIESIKSKSTKVETKIIKEANKFPLDNLEWGYLQPSLYNFLQIPFNMNCKKDGAYCILRRGIEYSAKQSFIAAIASIYGGEKSVPSIKKMKSLLRAALTLDLFITLQNGSLIEIFQNGFHEKLEGSTQSRTKIFKQLKGTKKGDKYLKYILASFLNFRNYLADDTIEIDYEYIWDLVCFPNPKLFKQGLNLIIIERPDNDITQNVSILCPSNHYSQYIFNGKRHTALILKHENFFEPIYRRKQTSPRTFSFITTFVLQGPEGQKFPWSIQHIIRNISSNEKNACKPKNKSGTIFNSTEENQRKIRFQIKENLTPKQIANCLRHTAYIITSQVLNVHSKVIGLIIEKNDNSMFLPCKPTTVVLKQPWFLADENTAWWRSYKETRHFLENIAAIKICKKKIPCKPLLKVIDDGKIVGIITQTDQFVPTLPENVEEFEGDGLYAYTTNTNISNSNYIIWESRKQDAKRLEIVQKIKLETNFYNVFRNMVRILLNKYEYSNDRGKIIEILKEKNYEQKLTEIVAIIKKIMAKYVSFVDYTSIGRNLESIQNVSVCLNADTCNNYCLLRDDKTCVLLIPEKHLLSGTLNERIYYGRIADEFIRYGQIRNFFFHPNKFMSFQKTGYNLKNNEILLLESLITEEKGGYFHNLKPMITNKYISRK